MPFGWDFWGAEIGMGVVAGLWAWWLGWGMCGGVWGRKVSK